MRAYLRGESLRCPVSHLTGMQLVDAARGSATWTLPVTPGVAQGDGSVGEGVLAILADGALGAAAQTVLPPRTVFATTDMSIAHLAGSAGVSLTARGRVVYADETAVLSEVFIDDGGATVAHGTSRCVLFPVDGPIPREDPAALQPTLEAMPPVSDMIRPSPGSGATVTMAASEWLCSPVRRLQGGAIAMLCRAAAGEALQTVSPQERTWTPAELKVSFLRSIPPDGRTLTAKGVVWHLGRRYAVARAEILDADDRIAAVAVATATRSEPA